MNPAEFGALGLKIEVAPISTRFSKDIAAKTRAFHEAHKQGATLEEISDFLVAISYSLLRDAYKTVNLPMTEPEFEAKTLIDEVIGFLSQQVEVNGPRDFLLAPLGVLLKNASNLADVVENAKGD